MNELTAGVYPLAPDCKAFVRDGKVIVSIKKRTCVQCDRCRDCKHFGQGYATGGGNYTSICKMRPKKLRYHAPGVPPAEVYYATLSFTKACDKFEPKNQ